MEIVKSKDRKPRTAGLLWGKSKAGKTTFLTSLPGKKLFIMLDPDGDLSLPDRDDIDVLPLFSYETGEIIRYAEKKLPTFLRKNENKYESVILDSLSSLADRALEHAVDNKIGASKGSSKSNFVPTLEEPGLAAYGARKQYILTIVSNMLRATGANSMHCWFTGHEGEAERDDKGNMIGDITLTLSGKTTNGIGKDVSEIWYLWQRDGKWTLAISPCRSKSPMGSRIFDVTGDPEFLLSFDPNGPLDQPHAIATWFNHWLETGKKAIPLPKLKGK